MVVHNETSTGVTSRIPEIRAAIDAAGHDALLLVDVISSLGSIDYRHEEWGVDVTVGGSQKGLMLPAGLGFNAVSPKALAAAETRADAALLLGLEADRRGQRDRLLALHVGHEPALRAARGAGDAARGGAADRLRPPRAPRRGDARGGRGLGPRGAGADPRELSAALTGVVLPEGHDADEVRRVILERFDMSLGAGLGKLKGRIFRIGHLGDFNDLMLAGTLCGVEMGLRLAGVPIEPGVQAALEVLEREPILA